MIGVLTGLLTLLLGGLAAQPQALPEPVEALFQQDVAWSPDGQWLAFSEYSGGEDYQPDKWSINLVRADGSQRRRLVENALYATWSADGSRLAFGAEREGNWDVYSIAKDGSDLRRLTDDPAHDGLPAWSPAGDRIAFCSHRDGNREIYVMATDGSDVNRVTDNPAEDYNPSWSPDGRFLVFYRETGDGMDQIYRIAADGSGEQAMTRDQRNNVFPSFLPDGRIAFSSSQSGGGEERLTVVAADGSGVTHLEVPVFFARWSPDGQWVAFISGENWPQSAIYLMRPDGSEIKKLVN